MLLTESRENISLFPSSQKIQCQILSGEHISKFTKKKALTSSTFIRQDKNLFFNLFVNRGVSKSLVAQKNKPKQNCCKLWALLWQQHMGYIQSLWRTVLLSHISVFSLSKSFDNICVDVVKRCFFNNYVSTSTFQSRFYLLRHKSNEIGSQMLLRIFMKFLFFPCLYI